MVQSSVRSKCAQTIFAMSRAQRSTIAMGCRTGPPTGAEFETIPDLRSSAFALHRVREHARWKNADLQAIGSILPPVGISGAVLLSVMTMSYLLPSRSRH